MDYSYLINTKTGDKWNRIGSKRRAGIAVPLFSLHSSTSCGIGDFNDLKKLIDWCEICGFTILQLLPLNDVGCDFAPYSSVSTFAIDPMYISFDMLSEKDDTILSEINYIRKKFSPRFGRVNYGIKNAKINLAEKLFNHNIENYQNFIDTNINWLKDYALFKVLKRKFNECSWLEFPDKYKYRDKASIEKLTENSRAEINFIYWLQWKLYEQLNEVKQYAAIKGIYIMGDLPFLVSRDSSDVWANPEYFRLDLASGAPPDMYFAEGQKWGMPPYNWENIAAFDFRYIRERLKYAENFYHMFRIDHFVGLFRVWTILQDNKLPGSIGGRFLPAEEFLWEEHGRRIIEIMNSTSMLPCAEDLGTVPECSYRVLAEYGIPGIDFQRYMKSNYYFKSPAEYRINSCAVLSTHDSSFFANWWEYEAGTIDEKLFEMMFFSQSDNLGHYRYAKETLFEKNKSAYGRLRWNENISSVDVMISILQPRQDKIYEFANLYLESFAEKDKFKLFLGTESNDKLALCYMAVKKANESNSVFSIQLLQEYLCINSGYLVKIGKLKNRINIPGKVSKKNWSVLLPGSMDNLLNSGISVEIRKILKDTERLLV